jgi:hypothetical protein
LGNGVGPFLSRDGKWVLAMVPAGNGKRNLVEFPTGAGDLRTIPTGDVQVQSAYFFADGKRILEFGNAAAANGQRLWVQDASGGTPPKPISPEGVDSRLAGSISPDQTRVTAVDPQGLITIYPVDGGTPLSVPGVQAGERPVRWMPDGKSLLIAANETPNVIYELEITSGKRNLFRTMPIPEGLKAQDLGFPVFSNDFKSYVYSYTRIVSDLYIVEGLK